ncbi:MAG: methyltransferase domain-containing protein, partial [Anaerolineae bacterium]
MKLLDHFALFAPFYDRIFATVSRDRLLELLDLRADGRLLDVGGGTGRVSTALANMTGEVVVTDLSAAMLRQAR